jgi:hypothetical protein
MGRNGFWEDRPDMRRALLAGSVLTLVLALGACTRQQTADDDDVQAAPQPAAAPASPAPEAKPTTEASAFTGGAGAYGMPHAPVPYDQLSRYEQQQAAMEPGMDQDPAAAAARPRASREGAREQDPKTRRESDAVFY